MKATYLPSDARTACSRRMTSVSPDAPRDDAVKERKDQVMILTMLGMASRRVGHEGTWGHIYFFFFFFFWYVGE